jgi:1,2-phenylacetyl-CoA epoxidase PaaB subunit
VAEESVYWVFGKEQGGEEQLRFVGSVNALNSELAENYARSLYGEDANWDEMAVVQQQAVHRFDDVRGA